MIDQKMSHRECPFRGLQPYTEADREYFFGREEDQETITANLLSAPITVLYGASGAGKSSVLLAGVVPLLRREKRVLVIVYRSWQQPETIAALKAEILRSVHLPTGTPPLDETLPFDEFLVRVTEAVGVGFAFIFDQFEEYFLYHPPTREETSLDTVLARAVNRRDVEANFLLSLREDSLSKLDRFQGRIPHLLNNLLRLEHLSVQDAQRAILEPIRIYNQKHPSERPIVIEDALVDTVLREVQTGRLTIGRDIRGSGTVLETGQEDPRVETPFLQMALERLWQTERQLRSNVIRRATLLSLGGAQNIVRHHLDEAMAALPVADQEIASTIFHFLVTPSGTKIAHRTEDLAAYANLTLSQVEPLLNKLCDPEMRLLRKISAPSGQPRIDRYEIYHDVLATAVLDWRRRFQARRNLKLLEDQLASDRKKTAWFPWIAGALLDVFACYAPIGGILAASLIDTKRLKIPGNIRIVVACVWLCVGLCSTLVSLMAFGALLKLDPGYDDRVKNKEAATFQEVLSIAAVYLLRVPIAPLVSGLLFRQLVLNIHEKQKRDQQQPALGAPRLVPPVKDDDVVTAEVISENKMPI